MASERLVRWRKTLWVVLASLVVHVLVVALFFLPDAMKMPEPAKEDSVSVELVPPPEEPKPPEPKPEADKLPEPLKMPEPEKPPEPAKPAEPAKAEQPPAPPEPPPPPAADKPPEEKPAPPPPPPEKAPEEKPPSPPPPEKALPPEEKPPEEPPKATPPAEQSRIRALDPVFRYGDKDAGPKKSEDGNSAEGDTKPEPTADDAAKPDATDAKPDDAAAQTPDAAATPETPPEVPPTDKPPAAMPPSETPLTDPPPVDAPGGAGPLPPNIDLPQVDVPDSTAEKNGPPSNSPDSAKVELAPAPPSELPKDKPAPPKPGGKPADGAMTKAKKLFSRSETGDAAATRAMGNIPRGVRAGELCASELREQLRHAAPVYRPELLPAYRLPSGNVLDVKRSQFRADGQWYNLRFRCELDAEATKVQSFSFDIGEPVPRSEWRSRGFPDN
ncbi:DUF930 domain-containing protein [Rhizobium sp. E27B/91]|uniref:DUF930 domain-containing protein n=1 Tax=Rhizobium sp. E27B/91 TaxID=2819995 RepID=UPI001ADCBF72|nr:DUF930 domain-containing protein [Rhizobium sp. E27B/91]MBO9185195.1 DUF930 domain-containing protein [Rhizobium sp. E27B/91]